MDFIKLCFMSVLRISTLKKFGIYKLFAWNESCPNFKKYNLIYGWNAAGKTTLSRVFSSLEKKLICPHHSDAEINVRIEDGTAITNANLANTNLKIRVFNCDFIEDNIFFENSDKSCNPIIYISEEDIGDQQELKKLKSLSDTLYKNYTDAEKKVQLKEKERQNFLSQTAALVKTAVGDYSVKDDYFNFNKALLEKRLNGNEISSFKKLSDLEVKKLREVVFGKAKPKIDLTVKQEINFVFIKQKISSIDELILAINKVLSKEIKGKILERLKNDSDLNRWVAAGVMLYHTRSKTHCLFCEKPLENDFYDSLLGHFSKTYNDFVSELEDLLLFVQTLNKKIDLSYIKDLYPDLEVKLESALTNFNTAESKYLLWISEILSVLEKKKANPFNALALSSVSEDLLENYDSALEGINKVVSEHNLRVANHQTEVSTAKNSVASHIIATALEKEKYSELQTSLREASDLFEAAKLSFDNNKKEIKNLEEKTSNVGTAIKEINRHLVEFFGRTEIQLELANENVGYVIKRSEHIATNLSESERTAIAFAYFLTKAREKDSQISETIIVLDDPISSFDSQFTFHCFSTIKNYFGEAKQLFISTHNFELFSLVKDWLKGKSNSETKCGFYMIENQNKSDGRYALVSELELTLKNHKSEYHYLFCLLQSFLRKDTIEYNDLYTIGNIARRFLEVFVNFKIPNETELKDKLEALKLKTVSATDLDKVFKLTNEFSHQKNPLTMMQHQDKIECKEAVKILFKIVQEADDKHFGFLQAITSRSMTPALVSESI